MFPRKHDISRTAVGYEQNIVVKTNSSESKSILRSTKTILSKCVATFMLWFSFSLFQNKLIFNNLFQISFLSCLCKRSSQRCFILTVKCLWWKPSSFLVYLYLEIHYSLKNNESEVALSFSSKMNKQDALSLWWTLQFCQNPWLQTQSSIPPAHVYGFIQREQNMWQSLAWNSLEFI